MHPLRAFWLPASLLLVSACGSRPLPARKSSPDAPSTLPVVTNAAIEEPPARWVPTGGHYTTRVIASLPEGTLVLMGGRRALVLADGSIREENALTSLGLEDMMVVPTPRGLRFLGHDRFQLYRFDEPLGKPQLLARGRSQGYVNSLAYIGAGPGFITLQDGGGVAKTPLIFDAVTGAKGNLVGWPDIPPVTMMFRSMTEGAVVFDTIGLALTHDGGKTFQLAEADKPEERGYDIKLRRMGDRIEAVHGDFVAPIDFEKNRIGPFARSVADIAKMNPTLAWIEATATDPIELAVTSGVPDPRGGVLIATNRMLARVDPMTGAALEVAWNPLYPMDTLEQNDFPVDVNECVAAHLPDQGLAFCSGNLNDLVTATFTVEGPLAAKAVDRPRLSSLHHRGIVYRPGRRLVFRGSCPSRLSKKAEENVDSNDLCASQPDGTVALLKPAPELYYQDQSELEGIGILGDGSIVQLKGITGRYFEQEWSPKAPLPETRFELFPFEGKPKQLAPIEFPRGAEGSTTVLGSIEEGADGALHAFVSLEEGIVHVSQTLSGSARVDPVEARGAAFRHGRGAIAGKDLLLSPDGGASWRNAGPLPEHRSLISVGEPGVMIGDWVRVGWGPAAPYPTDPPPSLGDPLVVFPEYPRPEAAPRRLITCKSGRKLGAAPPLFDLDARQKALDAQGKPPIDPSVYVRTDDKGLWDGMELFWRLEETTSEDRENAVRWTLQAIDPGDTSGRIYTWTMETPPNTPSHGSLSQAMRRGDRFLFVLAHGAFGDRKDLRYEMVLASPGKPLRTASVSMLPDGNFAEMTLGPKDDDPVVAHMGTRLLTWSSSGAIKEIVALHGRHNHATAGIPENKGLPVLFDGRNLLAWRTMPTEPGVGPAPQLPLSGWTKLSSWEHGYEGLPMCRGKSSGGLFRFEEKKPELSVEIDGVKLKGARIEAVHYDIRVDGGTACIEAMKIPLDEAVQPKRPRPIGFLQVDFAAKTGHAVESPVGGSFVQMTCTLQ